MPYSAEPAAKSCRSCRRRKPAAEYVSVGPADRICRDCRDARRPPPPVPLGDGRTAITLTGKHARGRVALVSDARVPLIADYRWRVMEHTRPDGTRVGPYAVTKIPTGSRGGRMAYMHTLITGNARTDHEDGDPLNNTDPNLRDTTQSQNLANTGKRRTGGTSRYKGVDWLARNSKWRARIKVDYEQRHLGLFPAEEDAARAYDAAAVEAWGRFARLNFPGFSAAAASGRCCRRWRWSARRRSPRGRR